MFGSPGVAYVYLVYGMYDCLNVVTEPAGVPAALLVRAVEPLEGLSAMRASRLALAVARRRTPVDQDLERARLDRLPDARLASGPGLVAAALGLDRSLTGRDLCDPSSDVRLEPGDRIGEELDDRIVATQRIGVAYAGEPWASQPWRLAIAGHPAVSGR
jgi:DNA-3-methyladenine glycosylase